MAAPDRPGAETASAPLLRSLGVLALAAVVAATTVVVVRRSPSPPEAAVDPLQVGIGAPSLAIEGDRIPVSVGVVGPDPVLRLDLLVDGVVVDSLAPTASETTVASTMHWTATVVGTAEVRARAVDAAGRESMSAAALLSVAPGPVTRVVEDPEGSTVAEVAREAGVPLERVVEVDPGVDPDETLAAGSVVVLPAPLLAVDASQPGGRAVTIDDGVLSVEHPPPGLFLYLGFQDRVVRIPDDPGETLPGRSQIDVGRLIPPLPGGDVSVEVWGRFDDGVDLLAELVVPASSLSGPATRLEALWQNSTFGIAVPVRSISATDAETVDMKWSSNVPHDSVHWFLSTTKPDAAGALAPRRLLQSGVAPAEDDGGEFSIDLSQNVYPLALPAALVRLGAGEPTPDEQIREPIPESSAAGLGPTWAWAIPVDAAGHVVGPPSPPVRIIVAQAPFDPTEAPPYDVVGVEVVLPPAPNPALASCVRIVSQTPPFPAGVGLGVYLNPDGSTSYRGGGGVKITGTLPYTFDQDGRALYPFTACPGERGNFQWGDVGCGSDPFCHVSKGLTDLTQAAREFGQFLLDLANELADAYNELKAWAIDQVASTICPDAVSGACKTMIEVAVDALLTSVGVPPTMPNFDDLANAAKGELVDLAMDQLGVGSACDAIAQAGTGRSCGELAVELQNMDACSLAPKGQEDRCRELVQDASDICELATDDVRCELLTKNAQDLVEEGLEVAVDESIEVIQERVTRASLQSIGFPGPTNTQFRDHACHWGGPGDDEVICPPWEPDSSFFTPDFTPDTPPRGCRVETIGPAAGRVVCTFPPGELVAIPEPLGEYQPIEVKILLARNDNPLPDGYVCGPITAEVTTITPRGAIGQPYLAATEDFPSVDLFGLDILGLSLWLDEPNPHVEIPDDKKPPPALDGGLGEALGEIGGDSVGLRPSSEWKHLLAAGSLVSVRVDGDCVPATYGDGLYGIVGAIPDPQPRITPGSP